MLAAALALVVATGKPDPHSFLRVDARDRVASLTLIAGDGPGNNGFNFDGYGRGELLVTVPLGWRVRVTCTNRAPVRNSCAVVDGPMTDRPAFRGAATRDPVLGLRRGETSSFSFVASRPGVFRLASVVPGHEEARMWDVLRIARTARPSVTARPGP